MKYNLNSMKNNKVQVFRGVAFLSMCQACGHTITLNKKYCHGNKTMLDEDISPGWKETERKR